MVKVCHMTSAHDSDDVRIFKKECVSLAQAGYDTYLVAKGDSREESGVHVIGVGTAPESRIRRMTEFANRVYKEALETDADIYHLHDPELLPYAVKLKKRGKKVIFDSHENHAAQIREKEYLPVLARETVSRLYRIRETWLVSKLDAVIVPCTFDGVNIFEGRARRTCFIANYPRLEDFYNRYDPDAQKTNDVCYVGGLTYERGIYHLVKAVYKAGKRLLLVGSFSNGEFEARVRALPEFSCVDYMGSISNSRVAEVLQSCRVGANTLLDIGQYHHIDTFGVKVFEYMSMGIPVLLPDYPYMREMVEKYGFGICVKTDDTDDISQAICFLTDNPDKVCSMGQNGRRAVEIEFNWSTQEKKLLELYSTLADEQEERSK